MAYQPIQMPGKNPLLEAIGGLGDSLSSLGDQRERQARAKEAKQQQEHVNYQTALTKAQALYQTGDYEGAAAMLAPYKGRVIQDHQIALTGTEPKEPVSPQGLPPGTPPGAGKIPPAPQMGAPQGGSPMPDALEDPGKYAPPPDRFGGQGPTESGDQPIQAPPVAPENPLFAAQAATKAKDQQRSRTLLAFTPPGGQEQTIDPMAGMDRMRERRIAQLDQAFGDSKDPTVQKYYPQIRAVAASSDEDIKPMDALRYFHYMAATEQSGVNADKRVDASNTNQNANRDVRVRGQDMTQANSIQSGKDKITAAGQYNKGNLKEGAAATIVATRVDTEWNRWHQQFDVKKVLGGTRMLASADMNINSGNPLAEHDAQVSLGRFFRGGMPTEGEMHLLYQNLAGRLGNGMQAFVEKMERGGLTPAEVDIVRGAIGTARHEQRRVLGDIMRSARHEFGPGSGHENLAGNINAKWRGALAGFGLTDDEIKAEGDIYQAQSDAPVPTVEYGRGNPQVDRTPRRKPPTGGGKSAKSTADYLKLLETP